LDSPVLSEALMKRSSLALVLIAVFSSMGAAYRTPNFMVHAPTQQIAEQVGQWAEHYRREKARLWLGQEMPTWPQPCPIIVQVSMDGPSGATSFTFAGGQVHTQNMQIRGPLDRLLSSVLPHEITHTVFAHHFRMPVPRWADEGGSVLSEDDIERDRHDKLVRQILNDRRAIQVRALLSLKEYPRDVMCLYAEGFSLTDYLVKRADRPTFLNFVGYGMHAGWDQAVQQFYGHRSVEELEGAWLQHLRDTRRQPGVQLAGTTRPATGTLVRSTAPPAQPFDPPPIVRGQAPTPEQMGQRFAPPSGTPAAQPRYVPYTPPIDQGWQPVPPLPPAQSARPPLPQTPIYPAPVQLGPPQAASQPGPGPIGFPR
jgi:hypothetical protein